MFERGAADIGARNRDIEAILGRVWRMSSSVLVSYLPVFLFVAIAFLIPVLTLLVAKVVRPSTGGAEKLMPYECGVDPDSDARKRYAIRYYVVAILFVIFDVETVFLFPWAIIYKQLALFGLIEMLVFLGILIVGYVWIIKKGALDWA
jgi:NADH-quinone oxidoreductase subunit A